MTDGEVNNVVKSIEIFALYTKFLFEMFHFYFFPLVTRSCQFWAPVQRKCTAIKKIPNKTNPIFNNHELHGKFY